MIKIKLECWWTNSQSLNERFIKQFVFNQNKYEFVTNNPDYTIVFGRTDWDLIETPKDRTFYFSQEPLWSPNEPKSGIDEFCSKIFVADKREYPDKIEYIETLLPMFYAGHGESDNRDEWDWSYKIKDKNFNKTKKISIIVRKDYYQHYNHLSNPNTNQINYKLRTDLGIKLSSNYDVDIFGMYWEKNNNNIKGEIWNKHIGLDDYQFSIGCENTIQKNYISEKFWDIVLTNTIPIYLGCSNISEYIDDTSFIFLNNLSLLDMTKKIQTIIDNSEEYYYSMVNHVKNLKYEFFKNPKFNLWEKIKLEINE